MFLETWKYKIKVLPNSVPGESSLLGSWMALFLLYPHMAERVLVSLSLFINIRVVNAIMRVPPSWHHLNLITSQSPHIKYHHFGNEDFNIWTLGGHKHSVSSTCFLIHEALTEVLSSAHLGKKSNLLFMGSLRLMMIHHSTFSLFNLATWVVVFST